MPPVGPAPADDFASAPLLTFDAGGVATVRQTLLRGGVHVYSIGPLQPGDRLIVDVNPAMGSTLDPNTAVFDAKGDLFTLNDDVDLDARRYGSHIDEIIRYASDPYYVAIAPSFFGTSTGSYDAVIRVERGGAPVTPESQIVFLNFSGGHADIPNIGEFDLPPFSGEEIDPEYVRDTDLIRQTIVDTVRSNFSGLKITILDSTLDAEPAETHSVVYFGAFSRTAFGISQSVDHLNRDRGDRSIIFTDHFDDPFGSRPSAVGIGVAIGNVAAHEIGHLLGLEHTADVTELMDTTGTASTLLADQKFAQAFLDESVFPIGTQNALELLGFVLGLSP